MDQQNLAPSQEHLDIYDIKDNLVILKNGGASAVIETSAINFDLLSQREQDAAIFAYSGLLNSINFPMQVLIVSKKMDITQYLNKIEDAKKSIKGELLKNAATNYKTYIEGLVQNFEILDKSFYISVIYNENLIIPGNSPFSWVKDLMGIGHKKKTNIDVQKVIEKAKPQLNPKIEHVIKEFSRMNIQARQLKTEELTKLFYDAYNPDASLSSNVEDNIQDYTSPIVEVLK